MTLKGKYRSAIIYSILWLLFSLIFAIPWIAEIGRYVPIGLAWFAITGMALIPGVAMAFVNSSLLMDKRPKYDSLKRYPKISIIVAAYNEEETIENTLRSILIQEYEGMIEVIVANDGSTSTHHFFLQKNGLQFSSMDSSDTTRRESLSRPSTKERLQELLSEIIDINESKPSLGGVSFFVVFLSLGNNSYVDIKAKRMFGSDWSPYYFSPNYINQYNVGYGFYRPFNNGKLITKLYAGVGFQEIDNYYMSMFNLDIKESTNFDSKWNADFIISTRNFNEYIYNTFTVKVYYTFGKKTDTNK